MASRLLQSRGFRPRVNVGKVERQLSLAAGIGSVVLGVARRDLPGLLLAALGAGLLYRGASGHCSVYDALGVDSRTEHDTNDEQAQAIRVTAAFLIDKPIEELYRFWRDLENLPTIMSHLESVHVIDEKHSHWIAKAPKIAGGSVEWDAEIWKTGRTSGSRGDRCQGRMSTIGARWNSHELTAIAAASCG